MIALVRLTIYETSKDYTRLRQLIRMIKDDVIDWVEFNVP